MSERSLSRAVVDETGMSFGKWRQQLHIMLALQWMAKGKSVQEVSIDLGYESSWSFITMFKKSLGSSPAQYMSQRLSRDSTAQN